jgi:hypothetical protein
MKKNGNHKSPKTAAFVARAERALRRAATCKPRTASSACPSSSGKMAGWWKSWCEQRGDAMTHISNIRILKSYICENFCPKRTLAGDLSRTVTFGRIAEQYFKSINAAFKMF